MGIRTKIAERTPGREMNPGHRMKVVLIPFCALLLLMFGISTFFSPRTQLDDPGFQLIQERPIADGGEIFEFSSKTSLYNVQIAKDGTIYDPEGVPLSPTELSNALKSHFDESTQSAQKPALRIKMNPDCDALALRALLDAAQESGYVDIYFRVSKHDG